MRLPPERLPFPVEPSYSVRPTLRRWSAGDAGHLRLDRRYPEYLAAKLRLLATDAGGCRVLDPAAPRDTLASTLTRAARTLAADGASVGHGAAEGAARPPDRSPAQEDGDARGGDPGGDVPRPVAAEPGMLRFPLLGLALLLPDLALVADAPPAPDAVPEPLRNRVRTHLEGLEPLERLADALALAVQEDLAVISADGGEDGRAELLHVCFPSSWDPAGRAGAGFRELHAPVPHGEALAGAAPRVVQAMVAKGPFVRYVWSLADDGALDRNPRRRAAAAGAASTDAPPHPAELWFRVERQTVLPMPELQRALFTIRVYRAPLPAVLTSAARRSALAAALRSMDEALLAYKGARRVREPLLAYLERG